MSSLERCVYPVMGDKLVEAIEPKDIAEVLTPHWKRIPETMRRVKQRIGVVLDWAAEAERSPYNPSRLAYTPPPPAVPRLCCHFARPLLMAGGHFCNGACCVCQHD